jgi:hypothetical protein
MGGGRERCVLEVIEDTVTNSLGHKSSDLLDRGVLIRLRNERIGRSLIPSYLRKVLFPPEDLPVSFLQR